MSDSSEQRPGLLTLLLLVAVMSACPEPPRDTVAYFAGGALASSCGNTTPCGEGLSCEGLRDEGYCTRACTRDEDCPAGAVCSTGVDQASNWCVTQSGSVGAPCEYENDCRPGLRCENRAVDGYCTRDCAPEDPCPPDPDVRCIKISGDLGNFCLRMCAATTELCRPDVTCKELTKAAGLHVCFPTFK